MAWPGAGTGIDLPGQDDFVGPKMSDAMGGGELKNPLQAPTDAPAAIPLQVQKIPPPPPPQDHPVLSTVEGEWKANYDSARRMKQALDAARKAGVKIEISSAARDAAQQQALWDNRANNPYPVAKPGTSNHEKGYAFDLRGDLDGFQKFAEEYGFDRPLKDTDPVHFTDQVKATGSEKIWGEDDPRMAVARGRSAAPASYQKLAASLGEQHGFSTPDISIMMRQLQTESNFDPKAKSPAGALGIPQFMPGTLAPYMAARGLKPEDYIKNGSLQTDIYFEHMQNVLTQNGGNWARSLAAYNAGQGGLQDQIKNGRLYPETQAYVAKILNTSPEQATQWVLQGGGPSQLPQDKDALRVQNISSFKEQGAELLTLFSALPTVITGIEQKKADTGYSTTAVVAKDLQERLVKPALRGITMGVMPILDWAANQEGGSGELGGAVDLVAQMASLLQPVTHMASEWSKPDEKWLKPEQQQLDTWRKGQDFTQWLGGMLPGGKSKIDVNSLTANLMSAGQELPSMAGALMAYEYLGPKTIAERLGPKAMELGPASSVLQGAAPDALVQGGRVIGTASEWLAKAAPTLPQMLGPNVYHEMAAMMTAFGAQSTVQGFGDALQRGAKPSQAVAEGLLSGMMGATVGGMLHLALPVAGKFFSALKNQALNPADAAAKEIGNAASPLLSEIKGLMNDPGNQFVQSSVKSVTDFVEKLDEMTGKEFTSNAYEKMSESWKFDHEAWVQKKQAREGAARMELAKTVMEAHNVGLQRAQSAIAKAEQLRQQIAVDQQILTMWERQNAALVADPKFHSAMDIWKRELDLRQQMGAMGKPGITMSPETQLALKQLKLSKIEMDKIAEYLGLDYRVANGIEQLKPLAPALDPELPSQLASDGEIWEWLQGSLGAMSQFMSGATEDLHIDRPQKFIQALIDAGQSNRAAIVDGLVNDYGESIKNIIRAGGLANAFPKRMVSQITLIGKTLAEFNPQGSTFNRVSSALLDIERQIEKANEVLAIELPKPPGAESVYAPNKMTVERFEKRDAAYDAQVKEISDAKVAAQQQLNDLIPQRDSLKALQDTFETPSVETRIKNSNAIQNQAEFERTLKENGLSQPLFTKLYENLSGSNPRTVMTPEQAKMRWRKDFGNRSDIKRLKDQASLKNRMATQNPVTGKKGVVKLYQKSPLYQFKKMVRNELRATMDPDWDAATQKKWLNSQVNDAMYSDPRSPLVPEAVQKEWKAAEANGDNFVQATVPADWVGWYPREGVGNREKGMLESRAYRPDRKSGLSPLTRPMLVGEGLKVLDGTTRLYVSRQEGRETARVMIRQSVLDQELRNRFGDTLHEAITGNEGGGSAVAAVGDHILTDAENHFLSMTPDEARAATLEHLAKFGVEVNNKLAPSAETLKMVQAGRPPTKWEQRLPVGVQSMMEQSANFTAAMKEFLFQKMPSPREAAAQPMAIFENLHTMHNVHKEIADTTAAEMAKRLDTGIRDGSVKIQGEGYYRQYGKLPDEFQKEFGEAIDSLAENGQAMQNFLTKHPGMRDIMGGAFGVMKVMEEFKVASPEQKEMFRLGYWPMKYPEIGKYQNMRRGAGDFAGSRLDSENIRTIPTFAKAQELYQVAETKLISGKWDQLSKPPISTNVEAKIRRFQGMSPQDRAKVFPDMTTDEMQKMALHLCLRNPVRDPIQTVRMQLKATLRADLVRDTLRTLSLMPLPGEATGTRLQHIPVEQQKIGIPTVQTLRGKIAKTQADADAWGVNIGESAAPVVPLSVLFGNAGGLKMAGETVPYNELFIHPEDAAVFKKYFSTGDYEPTYWQQVLEYSRAGQLAGLGAPYAAKLAVNQGATMFGLGVENILKGNFMTGARQALVDSWSAPLQLIRMGQVARQNAMYMQRAQMLGLNARTANQFTDALVHKMETIFGNTGDSSEFLNRAITPREGVGEAFSTLMGKTNRPEGMGDKFSFDHLKTLEWFKLTAADVGNTFLHLSRALEQWGMRKPIEDAILGAHLYWENLAYEGAFAPQVAAGTLSKSAAQRMAGTQAAEMVNRMMGAMNGCLSTNQFRNFMGNTIFGTLEVTPNVLRSELHNLAVALSNSDGFLGKAGQSLPGELGGHWGHRAIQGNPGQQWFQERARNQVFGQLVGGFTFLQAISLLTNGHSTLQNEPGNVKSNVTKVRLGDKLVDTSWAYGSTAKFVSAMTGLPEQGFARILTNQIGGPAGAILDLAQNKDREGNPILLHNDPGPGGLKNLARTAGHFLKRSVNIDQFAGPAGSGNHPPMDQRLASFFGINTSPVPTDSDIVKGQNRNLAEEDRDRLHQMKEYDYDVIHSTDQNVVYESIQKLNKIARSGPHPWDDAKFAGHLQKLVGERQTRQPGGEGLSLERAIKSINKRNAAETGELLKQRIQNEQTRIR